MVWEHSYTLESDKSPKTLFRDLLQFYTSTDYPFKVVNENPPYSVSLKRGSHFAMGGSWKKLKSTLDVTLRQKENKTAVLLHYKIWGVAPSTGFRDKAEIEVEQFKLNYL